ncbi:MAG: hypothetical protein RLO50_02245 [Azospirillaceae bacterium]
MWRSERGGMVSGVTWLSGRRRSAALLLATALLSLVLAWGAAAWLAPRLVGGQALIFWSGLLAGVAAALPWLGLWLALAKNGQRRFSEGAPFPGSG